MSAPHPGASGACLSPGIESSIPAADGARLPHLIICLIGKPAGLIGKLRRTLVGGNHNTACTTPATFRGWRGERIERVPLSLLHSQQCLRSLCAPLEKTRNKSRATPTVLLIKAIPKPVSGEIVHGIKSSFIFSPVKMLGRSIKASHVHTKAQKVLCFKKKIPRGEEAELEFSGRRNLAVNNCPCSFCGLQVGHLTVETLATTAQVIARSPKSYSMLHTILKKKEE